MAVFHYLVKNDEGARSEGDIRAESMDLALQKLTSNGQIVITPVSYTHLTLPTT